RFRDYVKAALRHLVAKYHGRRRKGPQLLGGDSPELAAVPAPDPPDDRFDMAWRDNLLARAWAALAEANRVAHDVPRGRADHPGPVPRPPVGSPREPVPLPPGRVPRPRAGPRRGPRPGPAGRLGRPRHRAPRHPAVRGRRRVEPVLPPEHVHPEGRPARL